MSLLEDAGFAIPRRGWPGRNRAIATAWLTVIAQALLLVVFMALMGYSIVLAFAWADAL